MCCKFQSAVMKCVAVVILGLLCYRSDGVLIRTLNRNSSWDVLDRSVVVDLSTAIHRVDQRFLSVTIDASLAADEKFMYLLG